jgi:urea transport system permease protein
MVLSSAMGWIRYLETVLVLTLFLGVSAQGPLWAATAAAATAAQGSMAAATAAQGSMAVPGHMQQGAVAKTGNYETGTAPDTGMQGLKLDELLSDDPDKKLTVIEALAMSSSPLAASVLSALGEERVFRLASGEWRFVDAGSAAQRPETAETVNVNNRMRAALEAALALIGLRSQDPKLRLLAARRLQDSETLAYLDQMDAVWRIEQDLQVKEALHLALSNLRLQSPLPQARLAAVQALSLSDESHARRRLQDLLRKESGQFLETDPGVREAAALALKKMDERLKVYEWLAAAFSGLSLGSVLLLAALGLAITYGLMGVINMAHGEFLMIGAYATYWVQAFFRQFAATWIDWYLIAALPVAFFACALIGMLLERTVLRWLYGRPLETLLSTWGVSLLLIQGCRVLFGAQNVEVENPSWLSGSIALAGDIGIPFNRIVILGFAMAVLLSVYLVLRQTRAGLFVRAVTQNRSMAACTGIPTDRVDMLTFGFGCGIAGLGGVALSQVGNVGPDLGQQYVVDSFMVVVLGGVGQLAGTAIAALGLGSISKVLEPFAGAVLAKIAVLIFIILFIQRRPQGLFALKGRSAEA